MDRLLLYSRAANAAVAPSQHGAAKEEHEEDRGEEEYHARQGVQVPLLQPRQGGGVHHEQEGKDGAATVPDVRRELRNDNQLLDGADRRVHRLDRRVRGG